MIQTIMHMNFFSLLNTDEAWPTQVVQLVANFMLLNIGFPFLQDISVVLKLQ